MQPREDLPLPTNPPYTAFIGNLAFDLSEMELEDFFSSTKVCPKLSHGAALKFRLNVQTKNIKIIKDRDDKPKGFGYIEFTDLDGLKEALTKSGLVGFEFVHLVPYLNNERQNLSGRTIRVSVAEPRTCLAFLFRLSLLIHLIAKERSGYSGTHDNDTKFDNPWRRDGPLPEFQDSRDSRRRFDGPPSGDRPPSMSEDTIDWRSNRLPRAPELEGSYSKRKGSGFLTSEGYAGVADKEDMWVIGGKFKPSSPVISDDPSGLKFGGVRGRGDMGPPKDQAIEERDWRNSTRAKPVSRNSASRA